MNDTSYALMGIAFGILVFRKVFMRVLRYLILFICVFAAAYGIFTWMGLGDSAPTQTEIVRDQSPIGEKTAIDEMEDIIDEMIH